MPHVPYTDQDYGVPMDGIIRSHSYFPVLPLFQEFLLKFVVKCNSIPIGNSTNL